MELADPGILDGSSEDEELNLDPPENELNLNAEDELDLEPETGGTASNSGTPPGSPTPVSPNVNDTTGSDHDNEVDDGPDDNPRSPQDDQQQNKDETDSESGECSEKSFDSDIQKGDNQPVGKSTVEEPGNRSKEINSASGRGITDSKIDPGSDDDNESDGDYISDGDDLNLQETEPVSAVKEKVTNGEVSQREHRLSLELRAPHDDHGELDYDEDVDDHDAQELVPQKPDNKEEKDDEDDEKEDGERYSDDDTDGELDDDDDCEEGEIKEVTDKGEVEDGEEDDGEIREMDPYLNQPICRFFMRGTCNWGVGCRFLHPGVPTAGGFVEENMGPTKDWNHESVPSSEKTAGPPPPAAPPRTETAWERGLRQAKELRKKSQKRKENEPDFEEKRKNLSLPAQDPVEEEPEKPSAPTEDDNKENIRAEKIQRDPYYDNIFDDMDGYNSKPLVEGWRDGGHYENFEVHWSREPQHPPPMTSRPSMEPYPDFRIPVHERERMTYKDKQHHNKNFRQGPAYERYDKRKEQKFKKYNKYQEMGPMDPHEKPRPHNKEPGLARGEEWADPWQRAKSPVRRKNSSSRSRSRGRRYSRSGSHSSSYSSGSYSSRSRSSSYTSRSSYSRSSSGSSRSSSGSRSRSSPLRRRGPPTYIEKKSIPVKPVEKPRSLVTKAGPNVAGRVLSKENLDGVPYGRQPPNPIQDHSAPRRFEGPEKPPTKQPSTKQLPKSAQAKAPTAKVHAVRPASAKQPPPKVSASKQPPVKPPSVQKSLKPVEKSVLPSRVSGPSTKRPAQMPPSSNNRPARNFRFQRRSRSSGSSRSRSYSSSGSSSRSRSRSSSASSSSSSSSRSADSDNLYGDMGIRRRKPARSPPAQKPKKGGKPEVTRGGPKDPPRTEAPPKVTPQNPKSQRAGRHQNTSIPWKPDDKLKSSVVSGSQQSLHSSKDPLKIQGQKSSIKLTLKPKVGNDSTSTAKKRPSENTDGPPAKKVVKAPVKEPKEPVRLTIPRVDKLIKPSKALEDNPSPTPKPASVKPAAPAPKPVQPEAPAPKPAPVQPPPAPTPPAPPPKKKSTSSRREELLKQLKAVEDAIARKRTKIN